ncbi:hypothetical protein Tco_0691045 [Tanacetum coccineum]
MVACLERIDGNADFHEIFWNTAHSQTVNDVKQIHATVDGKTVVISESSVRNDLYFNDKDGITCLIDETIFENLALMGLDASQASGNITKTQSMAMSNDPLSYEIGSGVNTPRSDEERIKYQELIENIPQTPHDSPLSGGYIPRSDEGRPDLHELMDICTNLSDSVLELEKEKDDQDVEILKLKNIIKKLERKAKSSIPPPKRRLYKQVDSSDDSLGEENTSKQGRNDSNKIEEFNLSDKGSHRTKVFDDTTAAEKDVNAAEPVSTAGDAVTASSVIPDIGTVGPLNVSVAGLSTSTTRDIFEDEMMTIGDTLVAIRSTRPRTTSVVIRDVVKEPRRATLVPTIQSQDKEQRIARERAAEQEAKDAALIIEFDNVQARIEADALLAARLQEEEREQFSIDE